jgi:hypothetical protein
VGIQTIHQQGLPSLVDFALIELLFGIQVQGLSALNWIDMKPKDSVNAVMLHEFLNFNLQGQHFSVSELPEVVAREHRRQPDAARKGIHPNSQGCDGLLHLKECIAMGSHVPISAQTTYQVESILVKLAVFVENALVNVNGNHLANNQIAGARTLS